MLDLREQMLAQIRELSRANDDVAGQDSKRLRVLRWLHRHFRPTWPRVLVAVTAGFLLAAAVVFVVHWPPGGGTHTSSFVFTQAASLVFVVILLSLLGGPVSAGQTLGWDSGWILRDRAVWLGLTAVGVLSLCELWLAWARPERAEAGASILLTGAGLALTVSIAWRLIYLSDPINQLAARTRGHVPVLMSELRRMRDSEAARMKRQGISAAVLVELELQTPPEAQAKVRNHLRRLRAVTERALHDGNWDLATLGHRALSHLAQAYTRECLVIVGQDPVLEAYCEASNDLHAQVAGTRGRDFSKQMVRDTRLTALAVVAKDSERFFGPHADALQKEAYGSLRFVQVLEHMANRRLADDASTDAQDALQTIGELAAESAAMGDSSTAANYIDHLLPYAVRATRARQPQIAWPAWDGILRSLGALATTQAEHRSPHAFSTAAQNLTRAIDDLGAFPHPLHYSGFEPIGGLSPLAGNLSLRTLAYSVWSNTTLDLDDICTWGLDTCRSMSTLAKATSENDSSAGGWAVREAAETMHHFDVAPIVRGQDDPAVDVRDLVSNIGSQLSWMRSMGLSDEGPGSGVDLDQLGQVYLTDVVMALHLLAAREAEVPEGLAKELSRFAAQVVAIDARDSSRGLADMIELVARALPDSAASLAETLAQAATRVRELAHDQPYDMSPLSDWGHLHRGAVGSELYEVVEEWLAALPDLNAGEEDTSEKPEPG